MTPERRGVLAIAAAALLWSTGGLGIKAIAASPLVIACWRSAFAGLALFAVFRPRPRRSASFVAAVVCYAACLTTFVVATKWTTAANAIFLQYSGVVWIILLAPLVVGEPWTARDATAVGIAFAGMALFFADRLETRGGAGDVVALSSGVFFAGLILFLRRDRGEAGVAAAAWGNLLAAAALAPIVHDEIPGTRDLVILALLGTVQLATAYVLFVRGIRHVPAAEASLVSMLEPIANPVWVFLAFGERPSGYALVGGVVVLAAIAGRTLASRDAVPGPVPVAPD
ncbi:MAG TPA: DMT family transporter [Candidatus Binatia bacterium]|nr:DMT family transporter [Candidatus Binatia bacterium]